MKELLFLLVIGLIVLSCFKAYYSAKLLEKDAEAWERLQQVEDEKRRRRQEALGKATLHGVRTVWGWIKKKD